MYNKAIRLICIVLSIVICSSCFVFAGNVHDEIQIEEDLFCSNHPVEDYSIEKTSVFDEGYNSYIIAKEYSDNCVDIYLVQDGVLISQYFVNKNNEVVTGKNIYSDQLTSISYESLHNKKTSCNVSAISSTNYSDTTYAKVNVTYYDDTYYPQGTRSFGIWGYATSTEETTYDLNGFYENLANLVARLIMIYLIPIDFAEHIARGIMTVIGAVNPTNPIQLPNYDVTCSSIEVRWEGKDLATGVTKQFSGTRYTSIEDAGTTRIFINGVYYPIDALRNRNVMVPMEINNLFYHSFDISVDSWQNVR